MPFFKSKILKQVLLFSLVTFLFFIIGISAFYLNLDDSINLHYVQGIVNGLKPYADLNIILTPLYHYTAAIFLLVFGSTVYSYYLFSGVAFSTIIIVLYNLYEKYIQNPYLKRLIIAIVLTLFFIIAYPNYNTFFVIFPILVVYAELCYEEHNSNLISFLIGITLGLAFLTKQSNGAFFIIGYYIYLLITQFKKPLLKKRFLFVTLGRFFSCIYFLSLLSLKPHFLWFYKYMFWRNQRISRSQFLFSYFNCMHANLRKHIDGNIIFCLL